MNSAKIALMEETNIISRTSHGYYLARYGSAIFDNIETYLNSKMIGFGYYKIRLVGLHSVSSLIKDKIFYNSKIKIEGHSYLCLNTQYRCDNLQVANHEVLQLMDLYHNACKDIMGLPVIFTRKADNKGYFVGVMSPEGVIEVASGSVIGRNGSYIIKTHFYSRVLEAACLEMSDEKGLIISPSISPYSVAVVRIDYAAEGVTQYAKDIVQQLTEFGVNVLYENSEDSHTELIAHYTKLGIPLIVAVGAKDLAEQKVNVFSRIGAQHERLELRTFYDTIEAYLKRIHNEMVKYSTMKLVNYIRNARINTTTALVRKVYYCDACLKDHPCDETESVMLLPFNQSEPGKCDGCGTTDARLYYIIRKAPHI